jgi:hypothetical protein
MKTNKPFFVSFLISICILRGFSQETTLPIPTPRGFTGVRSIGSEIVYLSWFGEKTETKGMANFVLRLYNNKLE